MSCVLPEGRGGGVVWFMICVSHESEREHRGCVTALNNGQLDSASWTLTSSLEAGEKQTE